MKVVIKPNNIISKEENKIVNDTTIKNPSVSFEDVYNKIMNNYEEELSLMKEMDRKSSSANDIEIKTPIANLHKKYYYYNLNDWEIYKKFNIDSYGINEDGSEDRSVFQTEEYVIIRKKFFGNFLLSNSIKSISGKRNGKTISYDGSSKNLSERTFTGIEKGDLPDVVLTEKNITEYYYTENLEINSNIILAYATRFYSGYSELYILLETTLTEIKYDESGKIDPNYTIDGYNEDDLYNTYSLKIEPKENILGEEYSTISENMVYKTNETSDYKFESNTLFRDFSARSFLENIAFKFERGRKSLELKIFIADYYDEKGNLVYSLEKGEVIKVGDIVIPYEIKNGQVVPIDKTDTNAEPVEYLVTSSEVYYNGGSYVILELLENIKSYGIYSRNWITSSSDNAIAYGKIYTKDIGDNILQVNFTLEITVGSDPENPNNYAYAFLNETVLSQTIGGLGLRVTDKTASMGELTYYNSNYSIIKDLTLQGGITIFGDWDGGYKLGRLNNETKEQLRIGEIGNGTIIMGKAFFEIVR